MSARYCRCLMGLFPVGALPCDRPVVDRPFCDDCEARHVDRPLLWIGVLPLDQPHPLEAEEAMA
jgi:hypothetical protein